MFASSRFSKVQFLFCLFCFMPYISPGTLVPSEVQPWAALIAWGVIVFRFINPNLNSRATGGREQDRNVVVLILLVFLMLLYVSSNTDLLTYVKKTVAIPLSIGVLLYARDVQLTALKSALKFSVVIYLFFAILQYVSVSTYIAISSMFVVVSDVYVGERGAASLAPEATDFGFTLAYLFLISLLIRRVESLDRPVHKSGLITFGLILLGIALSKSASGIIAMMVVLVAANLHFNQVRRMLIPLAVSVIIVVIVILLPRDLIENVRGLRLLYAMFSEPLLLLKTSFAHRAVHNIVGFIAFFDSLGLGFGAGSFTTVGPGIYLDHGLSYTLDLTPWHVTAVLASLETAPLSVIAQLLTEHGVIGLAFMYFIFLRISKSNMHVKYAVISIMVLTWAQSFPIAYPMFWLLAGLAVNPVFLKNDGASDLKPRMVN